MEASANAAGALRRTWSKCQHSWHFNFKWKGVHYRLSLDREAGRHLDSKSRALAKQIESEQIYGTGSFRSQTPTDTLAPAMTFDMFANIWWDRRGSQLVRPRDNDYRLEKITTFPLGEGDSLTTFGDKPLNRITTDDIERFRESRNREGLFKIGTETAISLEREIPRSVRFEERRR
jgi:hypothetical protein